MREGDAGRQWVDKLPGIVASLCTRWNLIVDGPVLHGTWAIVIPMRRGEQPCALKVSWQHTANALEASALRVWNGQGAVRLLEQESSLGAVVLERLDHNRLLRDVAIDEAITIAGCLLRRLAIPAPAGFPTLEARVSGLPQLLPAQWRRLGRPLPRHLLDQACELSHQLRQSAQNLLVNYDLHWENVLKGNREPWLAVDPMVVVGDLEYTIAQLLWWRLEDIEANGGLQRHFQRLVEAAELDAERARGWTLVRSVEYWLWGLERGLTIDPPRCAYICNWLNAA